MPFLHNAKRGSTFAVSGRVKVYVTGLDWILAPPN